MDTSQPLGLTLTRIFDAPRALVWAAWTDPEHLAQWWGPAEYPASSVDMDVRTGGRWRNCLRGVRDGRDLWQNGVFVEVTPPERIVMSFVWETQGERGIPNEVTVIFEDLSQEGGGATTRMVFTHGPFHSPEELDGHAHGWTSTFDRLDAYLPHFTKPGAPKVQRQANHHVFVIEREFTHAPSLVFFAWSDGQARREWFHGPEDWVAGEQVFDFRVGGLEIGEGGPKGGFVSRYESRILEIVPNERVITAFMMYMDGVPITASLATTEFKAGDYGTLLKYTEQIAFLDGHDHLPQRIEGTEALFDKFEAYVETHKLEG